MRSDLIFGALTHVTNRYQLCQLAAKATRKLHKPNTRLQDTTNEVLDRFKDTIPMDEQGRDCGGKGSARCNWNAARLSCAAVSCRSLKCFHTISVVEFVCTWFRFHTPRTLRPPHDLCVTQIPPELSRTGSASAKSPSQEETLSMTISELKDHNIAELGKLARGLDIGGTSGLRKQDLNLQDFAGAERKGRAHLCGRRARDSSGRLWVFAVAGLQLPAGPGRHLRVALADSQVRFEDGRYDLGQCSFAA